MVLNDKYKNAMKLLTVIVFLFCLAELGANQENLLREYIKSYVAAETIHDKRTSINLIVDNIFDPDKAVDVRRRDWLFRQPNGVFSEETRKTILDKYIQLIGTITKNDVIFLDRLEILDSYLQNTSYQFKEIKHGIASDLLSRSPEWGILLVKAQKGDTESLGEIFRIVDSVSLSGNAIKREEAFQSMLNSGAIEKMESRGYSYNYEEIVDPVVVTELLKDIAYTRQPEAINYLRKYLNSDSSIYRERKIYSFVAVHIASYLSMIVKDFPLEKRTIGRISLSDVEVARKWLSEKEEVSFIVDPNLSSE
jgi:hypothetical protein